jgi:translation elongation factor EF-G
MVRRIKKIKSTRNLCVIAHVDHGKTTLSDSFLSRAGLLYEDKAGTTLALDTDKEEIERGITIKSTGITLNYPDVVPRGLDEASASSSPPSAPKAKPASASASAAAASPAP